MSAGYSLKNDRLPQPLIRTLILFTLMEVLPWIDWLQVKYAPDKQLFMRRCCAEKVHTDACGWGVCVFSSRVWEGRPSELKALGSGVRLQLWAKLSCCHTWTLHVRPHRREYSEGETPKLNAFDQQEERKLWQFRGFLWGLINWKYILNKKIIFFCLQKKKKKVGVGG